MPRHFGRNLQNSSFLSSGLIWLNPHPLSLAQSTAQARIIEIRAGDI
jgi:hypothetical protein